jgi:periplasmic divalent cation tolerance protein
LLLVYITTKDEAEASSIGTRLIESRLAACANIFPSIKSIYEWNGSLVHDTEAALVVKTRRELLDKLIADVKANHSYECPCIVALPIAGGNEDFLRWVSGQTLAIEGESSPAE